MKETAISLEKAGSSLTEWVQQPRREHTAFVVLEAAKPIGRLTPTGSPRCTGAELGRAQIGAELLTEEARVWAEDLRGARAALSVPEES